MTSPIEGFRSIPEAAERAGGAAALRGALESGALVASARLADGRIVAMIPECWRRAISRPVVLRDGFGRLLARGRPESLAPFEEAMAGRAVAVAIAIRRSGRCDWASGQAMIRDTELARWQGAAPTATGAPGRPSGMHLIEREHARRCAEGRALGPVAREAADLAAWFRTAHPEAPPPTAKTIENRIRSAHRRQHAPDQAMGRRRNA